MNVVTRMGLWIEKHFPEKLTSEEVLTQFSTFSGKLNDLDKRFKDIESIFEDWSIAKKSIAQLISDVETLKNQSAMKTRIARPVMSNVPMTPFATRQKLGGSESLQSA